MKKNIPEALLGGKRERENTKNRHPLLCHSDAREDKAG
jgi:hypothetical protein